MALLITIAVGSITYELRCNQPYIHHEEYGCGFSDDFVRWSEATEYFFANSDEEAVEWAKKLIADMRPVTLDGRTHTPKLVELRRIERII